MEAAALYRRRRRSRDPFDAEVPGFLPCVPAIDQLQILLPVGSAEMTNTSRYHALLRGEMPGVLYEILVQLSDEDIVFFPHCSLEHRDLFMVSRKLFVKIRSPRVAWYGLSRVFQTTVVGRMILSTVISSIDLADSLVCDSAG